FRRVLFRSLPVTVMIAEKRKVESRVSHISKERFAVRNPGKEKVDGDWPVTERTRRRGIAGYILGLGASGSGAARSAPALPLGAAAGTCCASGRTGRVFVASPL